MVGGLNTDIGFIQHFGKQWIISFVVVKFDMGDGNMSLMIRTQTRECGTLKFDPQCNVCKKINYPMAGWDIEDDSASFWICLDCLEDTVFRVHHYEEKEDD